MLNLFYLFMAFFIGAIHFGQSAGNLLSRSHSLKISEFSKSKTKTTVLFDPWLELSLRLLDIGKAFLLTFYAGEIFQTQTMVILAALAVIAGHIFSPFLKLKGGKGISCMLGSALFLDYRVALFGLILYLVILIFFNYAYLSLVILMVFMPVLFFFISGNIYYVIFALICLILTIITHITNINNYFEGKEPTIQELFLKRNR